MSTKAGPASVPSPYNDGRKTDLESSSDSIELARKFTAIVKTLASSSEYRYVAELIDKIPRLEQSVLSKDREIQRLNEKNRELEEEGDKASRRLIRAYEREYDRFKDEKAALNGKIGGLEELGKAQEDSVNRLMASESELKEKGRQVKNMWVAEKEKLSEANKKIKKMEGEANKALIENSRLDKELTQVRTELSSVRKSLERAEAKVSGLEQELCSKDKRLTEIEGLGVTLNEECCEKWVASIEAVWESVHRLVEAYFGKNLPEDSLKITDTWTMLRTPLDFQHQIPLPATNSTAAKLARTAVILAILARLIDKHIFHPTFLLETDSGIRDILLRQAVLHRSRESFTRSLLLNMFPEEQQTRSERMVSVVLQEMAPYVRNLLPPEEITTFKEKLRPLICAGRDAWMSIQRLRERLEPSFELIQFEDFEWKTIELKDISTERPNGNRTSKAGQKDDEAVLMIFPRLCIVEDEDPYPLSRGIVITKSQIEKATQEVQKLSSTPPVRKSLPARTRRQSFQDSSQNTLHQMDTKGASNFLLQKH